MKDNEGGEGPVTLSQANLGLLPGIVSVPTYDRNAVRGGILHIGVGNFHRAHQAVYADNLLEAGNDPAWGIRGAGVRQPDTKMRDLLGAQDWLSSVVENDASGMKASVTGSMIDFLAVQAGHKPIIDAIALAETRIVSLTVTEGGYFVDAATEAFDPSHPDIQADIHDPANPLTVFGAIVAGLAARRAESGTPVTVMSCDNLPGNGIVARAAVLGVAQGQNPDLAAWIADNVTFPNGMVDRITPATSDRERAILRRDFGIKDASPVFCEPFRQWVLEDNFANGRPEFEAAGVTMTDSVHDFEAMKIRVLNGGHAIIAYPAALAGVEYVHDAMNVPEIEAFLRKVIQDDVAPSVKPVGGQTPEAYMAQTVKRFKNPGVADTITRLCLDGTNRQPKFIVPSIRDRLAAGRTPYGLALCCAFWCQYCTGVDDQGQPIAANDANWDALSAAAKAATANPLVWLEQDDIYGNLRQSEDFCQAFTAALKSVKDGGALAAIRAYLNQSA